MSKRATTILSFAAAVICAAALYYAFADGPEKPAAGRNLPPSRMLETGPYGENVTLTQPIGNSTFTLKARTLYLKKTKTLGFSNAFFKQVVAKDLTITVRQNDRKILELCKDRETMKPGMQVIQLEDPTVRYPAGLKKPRAITIDRNKAQIVFQYIGTTETWDLGKQPESAAE